MILYSYLINASICDIPGILKFTRRYWDIFISPTSQELPVCEFLHLEMTGLWQECPENSVQRLQLWQLATNCGWQDRKIFWKPWL